METEPVRCPGCGEAMTVAVNRAVGSREYVCDHCGGAVAGVAVFRHLLGNEQVGHIWNGEPGPDGNKPPRCGFCFADMEPRTLEPRTLEPRTLEPRTLEPRTLEPGHAAVCKTCQVIWFDKEALESLTTTVQTQALSEVGVPKCSYCGAAISSPLDERCRYCGNAFEVAPVVVAPAPRGGSGGDWEGAGRAAYWFARAVGAVADWSSWP